MSTEVCPFCGKAFKRLKSHLPHCKAGSRPKTPPNISDVTSRQTSQQLSAAASTKKSKKPAEITSPEVGTTKDVSFEHEHLLVNTAPSPNTKTLRKKNLKQSDQTVTGSNLETSRLVSRAATHKAEAEGPDLIHTKSKTKKKSLRALIEAAKSSQVTKASLPEDLVLSSTFQASPVAKPLSHSESITHCQVLLDEGLQSELLDSEIKPVRPSKNKSLPKSSQVSKASEDLSQETSKSKVSSGVKSKGSSKKSKKVIRAPQDLDLVSTKDPGQLADNATSKSRSKTKMSDKATTIESNDLFLNSEEKPQHKNTSGSLSISGLTLEPIQEITKSTDFRKDEAELTSSFVEPKYTSKKKSLHSMTETPTSNTQDLVSSSSQESLLVSTTNLENSSMMEATHHLGDSDIKPKGKKNLQALMEASKSNQIPPLSKDSISASALDSGVKELHHTLLLNSDVKPKETFRKNNLSCLTEASKPSHISKTSPTQSLVSGSALESDPLILLKTSQLETKYDPPQESLMNVSPAAPLNLEKRTSSEASTELRPEWTPQSRITIQSLKSTLDRGKPSRSILQDFETSFDHRSDQVNGAPRQRQLSARPPASQQKNLSNLTTTEHHTTGIPVPPPAQFLNPPLPPDAGQPLLRRVQALDVDPLVQLGNQSTAIEATKGLLDQHLAQVRLRELPNWLICKTPINPRAVVGVMQRGWWWYYRKYIDVKKGGVGGVSMLLAGYCILGYVWRYPHLKRERWRKYH